MSLFTPIHKLLSIGLPPLPKPSPTASESAASAAGKAMAAHRQQLEAERQRAMNYRLAKEAGRPDLARRWE